MIVVIKRLIRDTKRVTRSMRIRHQSWSINLVVFWKPLIEVNTITEINPLHTKLDNL